MLAALANVLRVPELRRRVIFTLVMFAVFRLGTHIPVPGVNAAMIEQLFNNGNLFGPAGFIFRRRPEQILHFCNEYYPVHQRVHYFAAVESGHSHTGRMVQGRAGRLQENQ